MADWGTRALEHRLGERLRAALPGWASEVVMFFAKQAWAALFGLLFLAALMISKAVWQDGWWITRFDGLFIFAVLTQAFMLWTRLENWEEARVIVIFHLTGTIMEFFKVAQGSWSYPEEAWIMIAGVPLFSGFMYASVGSYVARATRIFDMRYAPYPPLWLTFVFGALCYTNFFAHHFTYDIRVGLFIASVLIFGRTRVWFFAGKTPRWMPMPLAALMCGFVLWVAEFIGTTVTATWVYAGQARWEMVSFAKMGSWYLLLYVAFITVTLVSRSALIHHPIKPQDRDAIIGTEHIKAGAGPASPTG